MANGSSLVVTLTGGVASGKSTVADVFQRLDVPVFDADVVARDLVQPGQPALADIATAFGEAMLTPSGELDRPRMRGLVFADAAERRRLEGILHPKVRKALLAATKVCTYPYCVLMVPLLTEVRADYDFVDRVLVTDVSPQVQVARLMQRDRCNADEASRIIAAQAPRSERLTLADDVIDNDGDTSVLATPVERLHCIYLRLATGKLAASAAN